jgi:RNA recognition motif. (a.k.a. RRM, RBD, or RNP domain)
MKYILIKRNYCLNYNHGNLLFVVVSFFIFMSMHLWVGGLPEKVKETDIEELFNPYGTVHDIRIRNARSDTYCFLHLNKSEESADPIEQLDQSKFQGKTIKVSTAKPKTSSTRSRSPQRRPRSPSPPVIVSRRDRRSPPARMRSRSPPRRNVSYYDDERRDEGRREERGVREERGREERGDSRREYRGGEGHRGLESSGKIQVRLENLPWDMSWIELKSLGKDFAEVTFARTWKDGQVGFGILECTRREDADKLIRSLDGKRVEGCRDRLKVQLHQQEEDEIKRRR